MLGIFTTLCGVLRGVIMSGKWLARFGSEPWMSHVITYSFDVMFLGNIGCRSVAGNCSGMRTLTSIVFPRPRTTFCPPCTAASDLWPTCFLGERCSCFALGVMSPRLLCIGQGAARISGNTCACSFNTVFARATLSIIASGFWPSSSESVPLKQKM